MKVFFPVFQWAKPSMQGVLNKVSYQTEALAALGIDIKTVVYGYHQVPVKDFPNVEYVNMVPKAKKYFFQLTEIRKESFNKALEDIQRIRPTVIYSRYFMSDPLSVAFLKQVPKEIPVVLESQAIVPKELIIQRKFRYYVIEMLFRRSFSRKIEGIIGVTNEISKYEKKRNPRIHVQTVSNGVGVKSLPMRSFIDSSERIDLLFVGSINKWHGLDRVIRGLYQYSGKERIHLHIIGTGDQETFLKRLTTETNMGHAVTFHGFKTGNALNGFFNRAHIAIASLGIHRNSIREASVLKAREYCARGVPFLLSYEDPDFIAFPYALKVPPTDEAIQFEEVVDFVKEISSNPNHPQAMRDFAFENLDWSVKMKKTVEFFEQILKERG